MTLANAFAGFLRDRDDEAGRTALVADLEERGYVLEAWLLARWAAGERQTEIAIEGLVWSGRRAWSGAALPADARAGDVWLDVCELMPMLLLPRALDADASEYAPGVLEQLTPFVSWLALRPVACWQFAAFLSTARLEPREVQVAPPLAVLDRERILAGDEVAPVERVLPDEAALYATWFGKSRATREDWQAAARNLTPRELAALWGPLRREWSDWVTEGMHAVVTPETIDIDPDEELEQDPTLEAGDRLLYGEREAPRGVGFRTLVSTQLGLRASAWPDPMSSLDVQLLDTVARDG